METNCKICGEPLRTGETAIRFQGGRAHSYCACDYEAWLDALGVDELPAAAMPLIVPGYNDDAPANRVVPTDPPAGSWAATARVMAQGDDSGFDWDRWKDEQKDAEFDR
jgi:hypothetical protein